MFTKVHKLVVAVPIPDSIPPDAVVKRLQEHKILLDLQPLVHSYEQIPHESLSEKVRNDLDHFSAHISRSRIIAYDVVERIHMIPGLGQWATKDIRFPSRFQNLPNGVKTSANAPGGVTVYGDYRVEFRDGSDIHEPDQPAKSGWWLVEKLSVVSSAFMMPLVAWNFDSAHKGMLEQLMATIQAELGPGTLEERPPAPPPKD